MLRVEIGKLQDPDHGAEGIVRSWNFIRSAMQSHGKLPLSKGVTWSNLVFKILFFIKAISVEVGRCFAVVWARDGGDWPPGGSKEMVCIN